MSRLKVTAAGTACIAASVVLFANRDAEACGGCFQAPTPPNQVASDVTDERMLLTVSPVQTTLYDQIQYSGSPAAFAWVLPILGTVTVGLSADVLFDSIDALTATQITPPPPKCPAPPSCGGGIACGGESSSATGAAFNGGLGPSSTVTVQKQENVGPYATVQLHASDSGALNNWLSQNGFVIPTDVTPVLDAYVAEGFDFLALKLLPNQGVQAMRPVRVSSAGASLSLPLRMAAIGTGTTVGITIWVLADGRYEPQNFPFYRIEDTDLIWDWSTSLSNYATLRTQNETRLSQKGWEIESSLTLNQQIITNLILAGGGVYNSAGTSFSPPADPSEDYLPVGAPGLLAAGLSDDGGSTDETGPDGHRDAASTDSGSTDDTSPDAGSLDAGSLDAGSLDAGSLDAGSLDAGSLDAGSLDSGSADAGSTDAGSIEAAQAVAAADAGGTGTAAGGGGQSVETAPAETAAQVRADDIQVLFAGITAPNVRVTRIRSDIAHAAMKVDLLLQASADQSELSNIRTVTQSVNEKCPIYDGCNVVGQGTPAQAAAGGGGCIASSPFGGQPRSQTEAVIALIGLAFVSVMVRRRSAGRRG